MNPECLVRLVVATLALMAFAGTGCFEPERSEPQIAKHQGSLLASDPAIYVPARKIIETCQRASLTELIIRSPISAELLAEISELPQLTTLELFETHFSPADLGKLTILPKLRRLRLEDLALDDRAVLQLHEMPELEILNLPATTLTNDGLRALIARMPNLQLLRIGSAGITDQGMAGIRKMESLRFLHLVDTPITDAGLVNFHDMHSLESFYIDGGQETESGIRNLLRANPQLHFHRNQLHIPDDPNAD
jgi:hypothetical protein